MADSVEVVCPHCSKVNRVPAEKLNAEPICGNCKRDIFTAHPIDSSSEQFTKHISRDGIPVLVDFWAPWCGPCRMMAPAFEQATQQLEPRMRMLKVNTEEVPQISAQYGIRSIPTMLLFKNGREVARHTGAMSAAGIISWAKAKSV